ncbi:hypothetical protein CK203_022429 [Vitis vinifera]|uniref:Uncharacterized protein n=1 Tax=Vitis vinifera TaxID=29760 RepID=A0A438I961_VITVI|nr:hypothetical protein CK203_022429 [Vitis vinifera]
MLPKKRKLQEHIAVQEGKSPKQKTRTRRSKDPSGQVILDKLDMLVEQYRAKFSQQTDDKTDGQKQGPDVALSHLCLISLMGSLVDLSWLCFLDTRARLLGLWGAHNAVGCLDFPVTLRGFSQGQGVEYGSGCDVSIPTRPIFATLPQLSTCIETGISKRPITLFEQDILGGIVWSFLGQGWWLSLGSYASHEECAASLGSHGFVASLPRLGIVVPSWHELFGCSSATEGACTSTTWMVHSQFLDFALFLRIIPIVVALHFQDLLFVVPLEVPTQQLEVGQAIFLHKGCPDGLSEQTHPKLKLDTGELETFRDESEWASPSCVPSLRRLADVVRWCVMMYLPVVSACWSKENRKVSEKCCLLEEFSIHGCKLVWPEWETPGGASPRDMLLEGVFFGIPKGYSEYEMDAVKSIVWGFRFFSGRAIAVSGRTWDVMVGKPLVGTLLASRTRSHTTHCSSMPTKGDVAFTSVGADRMQHLGHDFSFEHFLARGLPDSKGDARGTSLFGTRGLFTGCSSGTTFLFCVTQQGKERSTSGLIVWEPQLYVFHIIPHLLLKVLVPGVHYVLKDLPFYKVVREVDVKVHQDRLDQRERKSIEQDLEDDLHFLGAEPGTWVESVVPCVIHELEEDEEDMVANLRAGFKERQRKCLSKSIAVTSLLAKRSCANDTHVELILNAPSAPMPLVDATSSRSPNGFSGPRDNPSANVATRLPYAARGRRGYETFITQQMGGSEELRSKLVQTEGDFAVAYKAIADGAEALRKTGE